MPDKRIEPKVSDNTSWFDGPYFGGRHFPAANLPLVYTPFTRISATLGENQGNACGDFEMDFYRCAARVGRERAKVECVKEIDDFLECKWGDKMVSE